MWMNLVRAAAIALPGMLAGGCIIDATCDHCDRCDGHGHYTPAPPRHGDDCANVRAAQAISFSGDRARALKQIAQQNPLSEAEQLCLIDASIKQGLFSSDAADVLHTLAGNPSLTPAARSHLSRRLKNSGLFSGDVERIASAMIANPGAPAHHHGHYAPAAPMAPALPGAPSAPAPPAQGGPRGPLHAPYTEPAEVTLDAWQSGGVVTVRARGTNNSGGWTTEMVQSPLRIWPPRWHLRNEPPSGPATAAMTPFEATATFKSDEPVRGVMVYLGPTSHMVKVEQK